MAIEITRTTTTGELSHLPVDNLHWSAIFAGLVVGIATNLVLLLLGAAAGLAVFSVGDTTGSGISMAAAIWNAICMIVAAFAGGYVAARSDGMRRTSDGILHGAVAWGVTMLISAFFVTSIAGATLGALFGTASPAERSAGAEIARKLDQGDREQAINVMRERLGLTTEQANRLVDQGLALSGREQNASPEGRAAAEQTVHTASVASGWLSATILLSLLSAMAGGLYGARSTRREARHAVKTTTTVSGPGAPAL